MAGDGVERRLAAILCADVVGYSRLMEADEEATIRALSACREIIDKLVANHHGRVFGSAGDSVIAEFASPVEAVGCAADIQWELEKRNADLPEDSQMHLRIGVNLGDVVVEGDNLLGDGVNVAARLQALADPGGINLSGTVFDQVEGKHDFTFDDLGAQQVKNIAKPVRVYRVGIGKTGSTADARASKTLPLPDKPSIAVLPFTNMSGDPEQEYFVDGMTEDLITDLSKISGMFVVARNSSFSFKGVSTDIRTVGRELGVRYVLEGSVRKAADRVRITAQLIDAANGKHLWAERYDRKLEDIFELQDEITATIVGTLEPELGVAELIRSQEKSIDSLDAWDCYLRARWHAQDGESKDTLLECVRLCRQAIAINPEMACAYSQLAVVHTASVAFGYTDDRTRAIERAFEAAQQAVRLDNKDALAHTALGRVYDFRGQFEDAVREHKIALELNPNSSITHLFLASTYNHGGYPAMALPAAERAYRLSPRDPRQWFMHFNKGFALSQLGHHDEAVEELRAAFHSQENNYWTHYGLAIVLAHSGNPNEAANILTTALKRWKVLSNTSDIEEAFSSASENYRTFLVTGARLAGMPT
jgi:TolB-like protein/class 3 adenylate cyclase/Flp pilus assembly protein TadD